MRRSHYILSMNIRVDHFVVWGAVYTFQYFNIIVAQNNKILRTKDGCHIINKLFIKTLIYIFVHTLFLIGLLVSDEKIINLKSGWPASAIKA